VSRIWRDRLLGAAAGAVAAVSAAAPLRTPHRLRSVCIAGVISDHSVFSPVTRPTLSTLRCRALSDHPTFLLITRPILYVILLFALLSALSALCCRALSFYVGSFAVTRPFL
jgi:hypothetical protein